MKCVPAKRERARKGPRLGKAMQLWALEGDDIEGEDLGNRAVSFGPITEVGIARIVGHTVFTADGSIAVMIPIVAPADGAGPVRRGPSLIRIYALLAGLSLDVSNGKKADQHSG